MTYPQPSSVQPVKNGLDHFRLLTDMVSPGDIYESEVSALGFAVGPNSDLANYLITYFSGDTNSSRQAVISPDRDLIGRFDARNDAFYPGPPASSRRVGRILIGIQDIWNVRWRPTGFGAEDQITFSTPTIDVIQYFTANPSVESQRSDKTFRYQYFATPTGVPPQSSWLVLPAFGRKSGSFSFLNKDPLNTVTVTVLGVKNAPTGDPGTVGSFQHTLASVGALASDASGVYQFKASTDGLWDMFAIELLNYNGKAMPMTITLSDDEA